MQSKTIQLFLAVGLATTLGACGGGNQEEGVKPGETPVTAPAPQVPANSAPAKAPQAPATFAPSPSSDNNEDDKNDNDKDDNDKDDEGGEGGEG
jgi:hypothetical protein